MANASRAKTKTTGTSSEISPALFVAESLEISLTDVVRSKFPSVASVCEEATAEVAERLRKDAYGQLAKHSPGLRDYDWDAYIRLSVIRLAYVADALKRFVPEGSRVLDLGSYFGNASLLAHKLGYRVTAADSYAGYSPSLDMEAEYLRENGIEILDLTESSSGKLRDGGQFDAVLLLGVIEHVPHSPKQLLLDVVNSLSVGGVLVLDTPNLAYVYNRYKLLEGESVHAPLEQQFDSAIPFEGHHREYTMREIIWMLSQVSLQVEEVNMFNYSIYGARELYGRDLELFNEMCADEEKKEIILVVGRKTRDC